MPVAELARAAGVGRVTFARRLRDRRRDGRLPREEPDGDRGAGRKRRPVLHLPRRLRGGPADEATTLEELCYRLTTLPPWPTLWASLVGVFLGVVIPLLVFRIPGTTAYSLTNAFVWGRMSSSPSAIVVFLIQMGFSEAVAGVFIYHSIHQLREISRIYLTFTRLNLYLLQPLYAFSVPAALTAGGLILYNYSWFAVAPEFLDQPVSIALGIFFATAAAVIFAWPLLGIHRRLVGEKKKALAESGRRFETAVAELHQRVGGGGRRTGLPPRHRV